jgi:hypothetical protein
MPYELTATIAYPGGGGGTITTVNPQWGYSIKVQTPMTVTQRADGGYAIYDPTADTSFAYDFDVHSCTVTLLIPVASAAIFIDMARDVAKGRGQELTLTPGTGWYPFGPYRGTAVAFKCKIIEIIQTGTIGHPENLVEFQVTFVYTGTIWPSYAPPGAVSEGSLQIGSVSGLRWPNARPGLKADYGWSAQTTHGPYAYIIDQGMDCWEVTLPLVLNQGNAAALQNYMIGTARGVPLDIITPANSYLFGVENSSNGTYNVRWIDGALEMTHESHGRWLTTLSFHTEA